MTVTVQLAEAQCAAIAAGLSMLLAAKEIDKGTLHFLTAEYNLTPLNPDQMNHLKDIFAKAATGVVEQPPPEPTKPDAPQGMRMRG